MFFIFICNSIKMATKKSQTQNTEIKIETTAAVQAIIADCYAKRLNFSEEIKKLNETSTRNEERLNSTLISYMEGTGRLLSEFNIVEYCERGSFIKIVKRKTDE